MTNDGARATADPFHIGWRTRLIDGRWVDVPLTLEDFIHPQEEDRFMLTNGHSLATVYLRHALEYRFRNRDDVRVFFDHRIDFQTGGVEPMGPDVIVLSDFHVAWDDLRGTLPVRDVGAAVRAVFEVTSESTRNTDLTTKVDLYHRAAVPVYVIVDLQATSNGQTVPELIGREWTPDGYVRLPADSAGRLTVPHLGMSFQWSDDRLVAFDEAGQRILEPLELSAQLEIIEQEAAAEKQRAEGERQRADMAEAHAAAEKQRAEAEKQRADALAQELAALRAKLHSGPSSTNGH